MKAYLLDDHLLLGLLLLLQLVVRSDLLQRALLQDGRRQLSIDVAHHDHSEVKKVKVKFKLNLQHRARYKHSLINAGRCDNLLHHGRLTGLLIYGHFDVRCSGPHRRLLRPHFRRFREQIRILVHLIRLRGHGTSGTYGGALRQNWRCTLLIRCLRRERIVVRTYFLCRRRCRLRNVADERNF
jgi:hypothetical protein